MELMALKIAGVVVAWGLISIAFGVFMARRK